MSSWYDFLSLIVTFSLFVGTIVGIAYAVRAISQAVESTKEQLKNRGLNISDKGVSVKTSQRFDREDYIDATQRGFIKAMNNASFGPADGSKKPQPVRSNSAGSQNHLTPGSDHTLKKRSSGGGFAGIKRTLSGSSGKH